VWKALYVLPGARQHTKVQSERYFSFIGNLLKSDYIGVNDLPPIIALQIICVRAENDDDISCDE
jgi:hypothetical protein